MTCPEAERVLSDLLAGGAGADDARALEAHLYGCEACRARAAALARQHRALAELAAEERAGELLRSIRARLAAGKKRRPRAAWKWSLRTAGSYPFVPALAAAGFVVGLILVLAVARPRPGVPPVAAAHREEPAPAPSAAEEPPAPPKHEPPPVRRETPPPQPQPPIREEAAPPPAKEPALPPAPGPPHEPPTRPATVPAAARLERVEGSVLAGGRPAAAGQDIAPELPIQVEGPRGLASLAYPDGTTLEVIGDSLVRGLRQERGKKVDLERGELRAFVTRQPAGEPMVFITPHGTATVLGTRLKISADAASTRLEVAKGRVRLVRRSDGRSVDVSGGQYAVAARGVELAARPMPPESPAAAALVATGKVIIKFGPKGVELPEGVFLDSGEEFDPRRGYGWKGPNQKIPGATFKGGPVWGRNPAGPFPNVRDPLTASQLAVGWSNHRETWSMKVPEGRYLATICVGDHGDYIQGPHHVWMEGLQVINAFVTRPRKLLERKDVPVVVRDGDITMIVGGGGTTEDESSDTILCYLVVRRAPP